jgi:hypothetical protein
LNSDDPIIMNSLMILLCIDIFLKIT